MLQERSRASSISDPFRWTPRHAASIASSGPATVSRRRYRRFKSARLIGPYDKPWATEKEPREAWDRVIWYSSVFLGLAVGALMCIQGYKSVPNPQYCLILDDNFTTLNHSIWNAEIQLGGYGTGTFDWTTNSSQNIYTSPSGLHIIPTLTTQTTDITEAQLLDGYTLNLTADGSCTASPPSNASCAIASNATAGRILPPVRSGRLNTKSSVQLTYGRVEVVAKMPRGDWLWPAIWMMPVSDTYGPWPASGEIDIAELRGNSPQSMPDGRNSVGSTIHWGPTPGLDKFYTTFGKRDLKRTDYSESFHTFGLQWSENYLFTYVNTRLAQVLYVSWAKKHGSMWERGGFAGQSVNGTPIVDPWSQTAQRNTPFDQPFYLILNVAVGGTDHFFGDGVGGKPWLDGSPTAMKDFWASKDKWLPTWGEGEARGMTVRSVKVWKEGACS